MNKTHYRLVFNKLRGMLMAVAEHVASSGKSNRETGTQTTKQIEASKNLFDVDKFKQKLLVMAVFSAFAGGANAGATGTVTVAGGQSDFEVLDVTNAVTGLPEQELNGYQGRFTQLETSTISTATVFVTNEVTVGTNFGTPGVISILDMNSKRSILLDAGGGAIYAGLKTGDINIPGTPGYIELSNGVFGTIQLNGATGTLTTTGNYANQSAIAIGAKANIGENWQVNASAGVNEGNNAVAIGGGFNW